MNFMEAVKVYIEVKEIINKRAGELCPKTIPKRN